MKKQINHKKILCHSGSRIAGEKKDCTVRALSNACDLSYEESHELLRKYSGRENGKGTWFHLFMANPQVKKLLLKKHNISYWDLPIHKTPSINRLIEYRKQGTFLVWVRGHITVIKDGAVVDLNCKNWHVEQIWQVAKIKN